MKIASTQRLAKINNDSGNEKNPEKEVLLTNQQGSGRKPKCSHCGNQHKRRKCNNLKAALKVQGKCKHCDKEGHLEAEYFAKFPEKIPNWSDIELSSGDLAIQLAHFESDFQF